MMGFDLNTPGMSDAGAGIMSSAGVRSPGGEPDLLIKTLVWAFSTIEGEEGEYGFFQCNLKRLIKPLTWTSSWTTSNVWFVRSWSHFAESEYIWQDGDFAYAGGDRQLEVRGSDYYFQKMNLKTGVVDSTGGPFVDTSFTYFPRRWSWAISTAGQKSNPQLNPEGFRFSTLHVPNYLRKWDSTGTIQYWEYEYTNYFSQFYLTTGVISGSTYIVTCTQSPASLFLHDGDGTLLWSVPFYLGPMTNEWPRYATVDESTGKIWVSFTYVGYVVYSILRCYDLTTGELIAESDRLQTQIVVAIESLGSGPLYS